MLTGGWDGVMRLYDAQSGKELRQFTANKESIYGVAFSPDGRLALSGSKDKIAHLWDVQTGQELQHLTGHTAYIYSVAFSPDGKFALTSSADNTARLWDLARLARNCVASPVIQAQWSGLCSPPMERPSSLAVMMAQPGCGM